MVYVWGLNSKNQLGDGTTTMRLIPTRLSIPGSVLWKNPVRMVTVGDEFSAIVTNQSGLYTWGYNNLGKKFFHNFNTHRTTR